MMERIELDGLDKLTAKAFEGYVVRKNLVRELKGQYPVPTYVVEFLLGRYCASVDPDEIEEGKKIVQRQLADKAVRTGEEELFKSRAREKGSIRIIDLITARLEPKSDSYFASLPSLQLRDVRISPELVQTHDRMLTGGFYADIELEYDAAIAVEKGGHPFGIASLREIQISKRDVLDDLKKGREYFTTEEWKKFLIRSVGFEPDNLTPREQDILILRMVPFVERNYNAVEIGPKGTGKSHLFQQISPYAHLVSGGKATVAKMFVNNSNGQRGLVCQYDVVCFDEIAGISFDQKDGVNIMKGYMESGEFSRGKESIRAEGGIMMVGNFDLDFETQLRTGHLLQPLPPEMRDDTAFMDRLHAYIPGWDIPKLHPDKHFTDHFGLVSDFLSECWSHLRTRSRVTTLSGRVFFGGALSGRDTTAVQKTVSGLLKLLHPDPESPIPDESLEWAVRIALEGRRRVKEQQKRTPSGAEFRNTHFSYQMGQDGVEQFVVTPELQSENAIGTDPLPPGQVWTISPGGGEEGPGLYRIEINEGPGSGVKILNRPIPPAFQESVRFGEQNLYSRALELVGDRDPRSHEFSVQLRALDNTRTGKGLSLAVLISLCSALLKRSVKGGLVIVGSLNLGGSIDSVFNAVNVAELAIDKGATELLIPVSCRKQLFNLPDDLATKITIQFFTDAKEAMWKALLD